MRKNCRAHRLVTSDLQRLDRIAFYLNAVIGNFIVNGLRLRTAPHALLNHQLSILDIVKLVQATATDLL